MTKGVLIFAHDNGDIKYTNIAVWAAQRIQRHLGLPVSLVTDKPPADTAPFDHIITHQATASSYRGAAPWLNGGRYMAGALSPYHETLLLDADYVVSSPQLNTLFDSNHDMLSMRWAADITARHNYDHHNFFGRHRMPSAWATVVYWRRSKTADLVFDMMGMIQKNWPHYVDLYGITDQKFRNDFALAIASNTVMGHLGHWPSIPWLMFNVEKGCELEQIDDDIFALRYEDQQKKPKRLQISHTDFHAMDKKNLEALIATGS